MRNDQLLAFGLALTPVIGAGVIWLIAYIRGDLGLSVEELRPIALALLAVGPAGALGCPVARAWYPRLQGLVTVTARPRWCWSDAPARLMSGATTNRG